MKSNLFFGVLYRIGDKVSLSQKTFESFEFWAFGVHIHPQHKSCEIVGFLLDFKTFWFVILEKGLFNLFLNLNEEKYLILLNEEDLKWLFKFFGGFWNDNLILWWVF